jgi:hypothetical protein
VKTNEVGGDSHVLKSPASTPDDREVATIEVRRVADLVPHPAVLKHKSAHSIQELSILSERGEAAFADPIAVTHENVIVEGYAIWQLATLQNRETLTCIVRPMDQEAALLYLLSRNRGSKGICDFARVLLALELEPWFRERAKSNQRFGGREKGSTHLTEADRLDVRIEVARAAGVSAGNVSKVKKILQSGIPAIYDALLAGDIRINRAATWARQPQSIQARRLLDFRNGHGIHRTIAKLLRKHEIGHPTLCCGLRELEQGLRKLHSDPILSFLVADLLSLINRIDHHLRSGEVDRAA